MSGGTRADNDEEREEDEGKEDQRVRTENTAIQQMEARAKQQNTMEKKRKSENGTKRT